MSARARVGWLGAYAVATFLSFPHPVGGRVLDLGLFVSWLGPAFLVLGLEGLAPRRALRFGFLAGWAAHTAILHWIYVVTVVYGHAPPVVGLIAPAGLAIYIAAFPAAFAAAFAWLAPRGLASPLSAALLWAALDHLRSFLLTGFPWATLGYAQHQNELLMGLAAFTAVYGLSFVTVLGGVALARAFTDLRAGRTPGRPVWLAVGGVVLAHVLGFAAIDAADESDLPTARVAVLQGNIDQGVKWSTAWADRTLQAYEELSRRAAADGARVIVWPETAVPGPVDVDAELRRRLGDLARDTRAQLVVGAVGLAFESGPQPSAYFDSAYLIDDRGEFRARYDKAHLVPFGEYVPFQDLIGKVVKAVARGVAAVGVTAGSGPRSFAIGLAEEGLAEEGQGPTGLRAGFVICYELLFPHLVRGFVADGAEVLFAITNDAWYGRTGAPYQFLAITAMRSAENRVWTARAANTGVSAIIDARGRVRARTRIFERDLVVADLPLRAAPRGGSFYTRHGDVFATSCWAGVVLLGIIGRRRSASGGSET